MHKHLHVGGIACWQSITSGRVDSKGIIQAGSKTIATQKSGIPSKQYNKITSKLDFKKAVYSYQSLLNDLLESL